jgi:hypothetical protein
MRLRVGFCVHHQPSNSSTGSNRFEPLDREREIQMFGYYGRARSGPGG